MIPLDIRCTNTTPIAIGQNRQIESKSLLLKAEATIILLGGTVALIAVLMGTNKAPPD